MLRPGSVDSRQPHGADHLVGMSPQPHETGYQTRADPPPVAGHQPQEVGPASVPADPLAAPQTAKMVTRGQSHPFPKHPNFSTLDQTDEVGLSGLPCFDLASSVK